MKIIVSIVVFFVVINLVVSNKRTCVRYFANPHKVSQEEDSIIVPDKTSTPLTVTKEELGRDSWKLLHSIAAAYPQDPTEEDKQNITQFLGLFGKVYPCRNCGNHFQSLIKEYPVQNESRVVLVGYICMLHNKVNERLHKPIFDCSLASSFWGGDCGCTDSDEEDLSKASNSTLSSTNSTNTTDSKVNSAANSKKSRDSAPNVDLGFVQQNLGKRLGPK